jgi:hypothetical protein
VRRQRQGGDRLTAKILLKYFHNKDILLLQLSLVMAYIVNCGCIPSLLPETTITGDAEVSWVVYH